jgi:hypothetical protein
LLIKVLRINYYFENLDIKKELRRCCETIYATIGRTAGASKLVKTIDIVRAEFLNPYINGLVLLSLSFLDKIKPNK